MVTEQVINREYMLELDEELKKEIRKFISLFNDRFVKTLLCKNIILLKKLLIYALDLKLDPYNVELVILNNELLLDSYNERKKYTDFIVLLDNKYYIDLEINSSNFEEVKYKNFLYICKMNSIIEKKGSKVSKMSERVVVQLNINANKKEDVYYKDKNKDEIYKVIGEKMSDVLFENFIIVLISLEKYDKLYYNGDRRRETIWFAFLASRTYSEAYTILLDLYDVKKAQSLMEEVIKLNNNNSLLSEWEEERYAAYEKLYEMKDIEKESHDEGLQEGIEQKSNEVIINMLKENTDINFISKVTNKPIEEIKKIASNLNLN